MFLKYNFYSIVWALIILILTLSPGNVILTSETFNVPNLDKVIHFIVFGVFAFLLIRGFSKQEDFIFLKKYSIFLSFIISIFFGIIIEIIQISIPGRGFDLLDILSNISGIALGLSVYYLKDNN